MIESLARSLGSGEAFTAVGFGIAFLGGLVAGFGPCVLPMMPAVFGYITGQVADTDERATVRVPLARATTLSLMFVLGMSTVFTALGAAVGLLGRALLVGAWAYYVVAAVCVVLGLQLLGAIRIPFDRLTVWVGRGPKGGGLLGAYVFGAAFGLVATPCSTPVLAVIATMAAAERSAAGGAALLFVYGLGKGVPLLLVGLASGTLPALRFFSRFVEPLRRVGGAALIGVAAYLVWTA